MGGGGGDKIQKNSSFSSGDLGRQIFSAKGPVQIPRVRVLLRRVWQEHALTVQILKAYKKPFTRLVEEGTFITNHKGELMNSKSELHQAKVVRTRTEVIQGGAEVVQHRRAGAVGGRVGRQGGDQGGARGFTLGAYQIIVADAADAVSVNFSGRCKFLQI